MRCCPPPARPSGAALAAHAAPPEPGAGASAPHLGRLALLALALAQVLDAPPLVVALELAPAALLRTLELANVLEPAALQERGGAGRGGAVGWGCGLAGGRRLEGAPVVLSRSRQATSTHKRAVRTPPKPPCLRTDLLAEALQAALKLHGGRGAVHLADSVATVVALLLHQLRAAARHLRDTTEAGGVEM